MFNLTERPYKKVIKDWNISSGRSDFLYEDDFDAIMRVNDADMLHNDKKLNLEINSCTKNMPPKKKSSFKRALYFKFVYQACGLKSHFIKKY